MPRFGSTLLAAVAAAGLAACSNDQFATERPTPPAPVAAPPPVVKQPPAATRKSQAEIREARAKAARAANLAAQKASFDTSGASDEVRAYLKKVEQDLLSRGQLRTDLAPADAPFDADKLARDFIRVALRDEYGRDGSRLVPDAHNAPLRRWEVPVRLQLEFGAATDLADRVRDRAEIAAFAARLAQASGHPVGLAPDGGNFIVLILNEDERRDIGPRLAQLVPGIPSGDIAALQGLSPQNYCTVFAYSKGARSDYVQAVALIRAELPPRLRTSCIHEELAQGMGLANDDPSVRPSIFNDDEEFALLTQHDELLLAMLYDPRLQPGMTEAEAFPIIQTIAAGLISGTAQ